MRVVLVSTYELGRQPFGLASPAAWLRARGHEVTCADLTVGLLPAKAVREADCIAFHLPMHTATRMALPVLERVRDANPSVRLVAYGLYAPLNAEHLRELGVHDIIGGEFESGLVEAVEGRLAGALIQLERQAFAVPDRTTLPKLERYAHLHVNGERRTVGYTEASRGCKHLCRHCPVVPVYNGVFRVVPAEIVLEDIRRQASAGARHITFGDPDFLNGPTHAMRIVEALHQEWPELTYDATIKVEHLLKHRALLPALARTGCVLITTAVESTEDLVLEKLDKRHTRADFLAALVLAREAGLHLNPTFVPFTPWTTLEGYRDLLALLLETGLASHVAPIQLALRLLIPAHSLILSLPEVEPLLEGFDPAGLLHRWHHPDPDVDELARGVFDLVASRQRAANPPHEIFRQIWQLVHGAAPPENFDLIPRAAVPYLDEPWYC
ncbi:CUAEP/CCAEP-tail radical SAM (seleno)protein [Paludibaculum fermentans]|uniref:Radical SAM protein n=1 Tax=Paludibaculum fermentans TaxID=1473598 RepID=A0A7S7SHN8_PALFE|nr:CUAEP/CCAEP-tail radical SAM protein [Paludibaculum fermentans]QOY85164.1 radical SAM protein [Paludibaculum fermentans]